MSCSKQNARAAQRWSCRRGHTLLEALLVLGLLALVVVLVLPNLFGMLRTDLFHEDVSRFVYTLRLAAHEAVYRGRNIAVVIDITDGYYTVYEATPNDRYGGDMLPLIERQGLDACYIEYLDFADGDRRFSGDIVLHATPQGWADSWLFTLIDLGERRRYVRCDLLTTSVVSDNKPLALVEPRRELDLSSSF